MRHCLLTPFRSFSLALLACYGLSLSATSHAREEVRYYDFEVIIFESLDNEARQSEVWKNTLSREIPQTYVELGEPYPGPIPKDYDPKLTFKMLPVKDWQLGEEARLLEESSQYRVLMHFAWRQPGMAADTALPIHIHKSFRDPTADVFNGTRHPDMPAVNLPTPNPQSTGQPGLESTLDGFIRITLSRYLHANFDLVLKTMRPVVQTQQVNDNEGSQDSEDAASPTQNLVMEPVFYHMQQTRKMRSKEVHYIDHPVLGVLILATPYKPEKP